MGHAAGNDVIGKHLGERLALFSGFEQGVDRAGPGRLGERRIGRRKNTVERPGADSVSTRAGGLPAATSVVWSFEFTAFWMMFFDGYIGAPPTVTVFGHLR